MPGLLDRVQDIARQLADQDDRIAALVGELTRIADALQQAVSILEDMANARQRRGED
ncbi:MAG: hypothetical protein MUC79_15410 [Thiobacillaceae bacterium]|nr:hypothetical protein [Thiobacillaceae bacterium]